MSSDNDHELQGLERQVTDLTMASGTKTRPVRSTSTLRSRRRQESDDDDDDIIGHLLQSPTFDPKTTSPKKVGLARSLSAGARKFPKKLLPNEPVPSIPSTTTTTTITDEQKDAEDLQQAMQLAWAVLDAEPVDDDTPTAPNQDVIKEKVTKQVSPTQHQATKTMTTRIYIEDAKNHKTVQLTNVLTTAMVIQYLKRKDLIDNSDDWTLFEIANSHGVERPLRQWEIVMDITCCWEQKANNALLVKKYGFYDTLTMNTIRDRPSPVHGYLNIEYKKGKWQKRYCFIKDHAIYHAKDSKSTNSAILCHLASFDVYTLLKPCSTCPTPFVFALRAQDRAAGFEKEEDYMRLLTAENQSCLEMWVLGIRQAKSILQYQQNSKIVMNPLAAVTPPEGGEQGLRRHKSTKRETVPEETNTSNNDGRPKGMSRSDSSTRRITDETIKRKASTRGLSRNGTTRNRDHHAHQHESKDTDEGNTTTLIQIDDRVQFSKGSLLDKNIMAIPVTAATTSTTPSTPSSAVTTATTASAPTPPHQSSRTAMSRSKSTRETTSGHHPRSREEGTLSHHTSIRRNKQHDVPLPNTKSIMTTSSDTTLLQLNNTPERFHTQTLLQRQMKPLLNFDQDLSRRR